MGRKIYDEDIRLNLILNGEQLNAGSKKMVAELGKLEREMVNLEQAAKATAAKIKLLEQNTAANAVQLAAERQNLHNTTIAMQAKSKAIEDMRKQIGLAGMTVSQLNNHLKALRLQLNNTAGDVEMQRRLRQEIMETEIMLRTRLTGASRLAQAWERVERAVNRAGTIVGWFAIALFGISRLVGGVISRMKDLEDLMGSVRKNTGLTAAEVWDMKEAFDQMDTRTKTDDLLKLSVVAGKLGINGKEDIQRFVEAANMIQVALGDDLNGSVEDTVTNIAKLMNSFRVDKEMSIDKAMLKTGSVLNELAKSSAASAETILNYMTRLSAVGELAGFTPAQIGGIASTLDAMNVPAERGATAIQKIMLAMANPKRISDFAEALKLNSDEYKELLKNNPNYVLTQLLTKFVANKDGLIDLTAGMKDFGAKGQYMTEVVGALAQNLDVMTEQQKIAEKAWKDGTSVVDEYNIMNSNFTSEVLKQQKIIRAQTDQINKDAEPAVLNIVKAWTKFVVATKDTVYWIGAHWQAIKNLTAVYIALRFPAIWRIGSIIAETAVEKAGLAIKQLKIFWMKTEIFWIVITTRSTQALTIEQLRMIGTSTLLTFATTLMTQGFKAAWVELVALRTATGAMAFPIAGAIIAITAITVAIGYLVFKKKELTESEKRQLELQKSIQADFFKEKANLTVLIDQLKDVNISQTARKRLIGEINEQYGEYLPKLLTEKTTTEELTGAYNLLIEALARKISTQKLTESGADILNRIDLNKEEIDAQTKSLEAFKERHKAELEIAKYNPRAYGVELSSMFQMEKNLKDLKNKGVELQNEYGTILNKLSNLTPKKGFNIKGGGLTSTEDDTETFKNRQAERESNFKKEEVQIKEQYANKVGMQDELNEKLRKSNLNFVNESIADYEKANRTEGENAAAYWALREKRADLMLSSEKGTTKAIKEENKERIKDAKEFEQELIDIEKFTCCGL
jgi:TP901 family phage tail tape measure protein